MDKMENLIAPDQKINPPVESFPLVGPSFFSLSGWIKKLSVNKVKAVAELHQRYGDVAKIKGTPYIFLFRPEMVDYVLKKQARNFRKGGDYKELQPILGNGLVMSHGELWKHQRKLIGNEFQRTRVQSYFPTINDLTLKALNALPAHAKTIEADMSDFCMQLTLNIAGTIFFGMDIENSSEKVKANFKVISDHVIGRVFSLVKSPRWLPTPGNLKAKRAIAGLDSIVFEVIDRSIQEQEQTQKQPKINVLTRLIQGLKAQGQNPEAFFTPQNRQQLRDEVMTMMLAGHETTSNALMWTLYLLAQNPEIQKHAKAEIDQLLSLKNQQNQKDQKDQKDEKDQGENTSLSLADLDQLQFLKATLLEGMRHFPPIPAISRTAFERDECMGVPLKPGSIIAIPISFLHKDPRYWNQAESYLPQRFLPPTHPLARPDLGPKHVASFLPFAQGPRRCVGEEFSLLESVIVLFQVLAKYKVETVAGFEPEMRAAVTLYSENGMKLKLTAYEKN